MVVDEIVGRRQKGHQARIAIGKRIGRAEIVDGNRNVAVGGIVDDRGIFRDQPFGAVAIFDDQHVAHDRVAGAAGGVEPADRRHGAGIGFADAQHDRGILRRRAEPEFAGGRSSPGGIVEVQRQRERRRPFRAQRGVGVGQELRDRFDGHDLEQLGFGDRDRSRAVAAEIQFMMTIGGRRRDAGGNVDFFARGADRGRRNIEIDPGRAVGRSAQLEGRASRNAAENRRVARRMDADAPDLLGDAGTPIPANGVAIAGGRDGTRGAGGRGLDDVAVLRGRQTAGVGEIAADRPGPGCNTRQHIGCAAGTGRGAVDDVIEPLGIDNDLVALGLDIFRRGDNKFENAGHCLFLRKAARGRGR
ncbi:MAG TPA: hypothetical protein VIH40_13790 [Xanthobacteraceae bacterium]